MLVVPPKLTSDDDQKIVDLYGAGASLADCARQTGHSLMTVRGHLVALGVVIRTRSEQLRIRVGHRKAYETDLGHLARLYESGLSEQVVSLMLGISRGFVHSELLKAGVELRPMREQLLIVNARRTPERRREITAAARAASKGR